MDYFRAVSFHTVGAHDANIPVTGEPSSDDHPSESAGQPAEALFALVYDELREMASRRLVRERAGHTLQPTALVHEVYMKMAEQRCVDWRGRSHFLAVAAQAMRRVLIDHGRAQKAAKRGGAWGRVTLTGADADSSSDPANIVDAIVLHEALIKLALLDERQARVAEARLYAGMTVAEIAQALGVSERTVKNDWRVARAWLASKLSDAAPLE